MDFLDNRTIIVCGVLILLVLTAFLFMSSHRKEYRGKNHWNIGNVLITTGSILLVMQGVINVFFSVIVSNVFLMVSYSLLSATLIIFLDKKASKTFYTLLNVSYVSLMLIFTYISYNTNMRILITSLGFMITIVYTMVKIYQNRELTENKTYFFIFITYFITFCTYFCRFIVIMYADSVSILGGNIVISITLLVHLVSHIIYTINLYDILVNRSERELINKINDLKHSEERFHKLFMDSPDIMILSEIETDKYVDVNNSFLECFGYTRDDVIGQTLEKLVYTLSTRKILFDELKAKGSITNYPVTFRTKDNREVQLLISADETIIEGNKFLISSSKDMTEQKKIERELARLDRLDLIGHMAASISHEIRNPLTCVKGFLQLLEGKEPDSAKRSYYDLMIDEIDRANHIITEFLSLARNKVVNYKLHNLNHIIDAIYPLVLAEALKQDKNVIFEKGYIQDIKVDEKEIRQLLLNLVRNSLEAVEPNRVVWIKTYMETEDTIVLSVQDQGPGINKSILNKIGTPFMTTKENGTGLGLAVCYNIADRNNAQIKVETGPSGTTFQIIFSCESSNTINESNVA